MLKFYKDGKLINEPKTHKLSAVEVEMKKSPTLYGTRAEEKHEGLSKE